LADFTAFSKTPRSIVLALPRPGPVTVVNTPVAVLLLVERPAKTPPAFFEPNMPPLPIRPSTNHYGRVSAFRPVVCFFARSQVLNQPPCWRLSMAVRTCTHLGRDQVPLQARRNYAVDHQDCFYVG
jgi:hypothetical protein